MTAVECGYPRGSAKWAVHQLNLQQLPTISEADVKAAFRAQALLVHPDKNIGVNPQLAEERFVELQFAYERALKHAQAEQATIGKVTGQMQAFENRMEQCLDEQRAQAEEMWMKRTRGRGNSFRAPTSTTTNNPPTPMEKKTSSSLKHPSSAPTSQASSFRKEGTSSSTLAAAGSPAPPMSTSTTTVQYAHIPKPTGLSSPHRTQSPIGGGRTSSPFGRHVSPMLQRAAQSPTRATQYRSYTSTTHQPAPTSSTPPPTTAPSRQGSFYDRSMSSSHGASQNCMPIRRGASFTKGHPTPTTGISGVASTSSAYSSVFTSSLGPATYYASEALKNSVEAIRVVRRGNSPSRGGAIPPPPQRAPPTPTPTSATSSHNVSLEGDDFVPTSSRPAMRAPPRPRTFTAPQAVVQQHPQYHQGPPVATVASPPPPQSPAAVDESKSSPVPKVAGGGASEEAISSLSSSRNKMPPIPTQDNDEDSLASTTADGLLSPLLPSSPIVLSPPIAVEDATKEHPQQQQRVSVLSSQRSLLAQQEVDARLVILRSGAAALSSIIHTSHQVAAEVLYPQQQYRRAILQKEGVARGLIVDTMELLCGYH